MATMYACPASAASAPRVHTLFAAILVGSMPFTAAAQSEPAPSRCEALGAEMDALSAQLSRGNGAVQAQAAEMMAAQAAYADAAKAQRRSGAVGDAISGVVGSIMPGSEIIAGIAGAAVRGAGSQPIAPGPKAAPEMTTALVAQANLAVRIGVLLEERSAAGCP